MRQLELDAGRLALVTGLLMLIGAGCTGAIPEGGQGAGAPEPGGDNAEPFPGIQPGDPGPTAMRRLTNDEYRNTLQDLLKLPAPPSDPLMPDPSGLGYDNFPSSISSVLGSQYATMAARLAGEANVAQVAPCASTGMESTCADKFISAFGKRAHRRPLTSADTKAYRALFDLARTTGTYADGIKLVTEAMLQSPHLLYRLEYGATGARRTLTPHEVASELSYLLTLSMPDAELMAAADANALETPAQIEAQARRLLELPRAKIALRKFVAQWMTVGSVTGINKDATLFPMFDDALKSAMAAESDRFIDAVLWEGDGTLKTLLSAPFSFVNSALARVYDLSDPGGDELVMANLNDRQRAGILTHASLLSVQAHAYDSFPIARGLFIRVRLMCQPLPPPPMGEVIALPPPDPKLTTRERFAAHSENPACAGCHALIDPLGFGLENYDAIGRFRTMENGRPIDARGQMSESDVDGPYTGGVELAGKLSSSATVRLCAGIQAARWVFGRPEIESDREVAKTMEAQLGAAGLDLRELLVAMTKTESFLTRTFVP